MLQRPNHDDEAASDVMVHATQNWMRFFASFSMTEPAHPKTKKPPEGAAFLCQSFSITVTKRETEHEHRGANQQQRKPSSAAACAVPCQPNQSIPNPASTAPPVPEPS